MPDNLISKLSLDSLREALQQAGYRVETVTDPVANTPYLRSATSGLAFDVRPGNRPADDPTSFVDVAFTAVLQVQGELPLDVVNRWNATRRFGRLQLSPPFLVFNMDFAVAGGVTPDHLRAQIEIWDRLVQELIAHLREELGKLNAASAAKAPAARQPPLPPQHDRAAEPDAPATIQ
jgi:hypothetical protein